MTKIQPDSLGTKIQFYRMQRNMTQAELAKAVDIEASYVGKIESHKVTPRMDTLQKIADVLKVNIDQLAEGLLAIYNKPEEETELDHLLLNKFYSLPANQKEGILRIVDKLEVYRAQMGGPLNLEGPTLNNSNYTQEIVADINQLDLEGQLLVNDCIKGFIHYLDIIGDRNHE